MASALHKVMTTTSHSRNPWSVEPAFQIGKQNRVHQMTVISSTIASIKYVIRVRREPHDLFGVTVVTDQLTSTFTNVRATLMSKTAMRLETKSGIRVYSVVAEEMPLENATSQITMQRIFVFHQGKRTLLQVSPPQWLQHLTEQTSAALSGGLRSPMPSLVVDVKTSVGSRVEKGQVVVVLESMKTEIVLRADRSGLVRGVNCKQGDMVAEGLELVLISDE